MHDLLPRGTFSDPGLTHVIAPGRSSGSALPTDVGPLASVDSIVFAVGKDDPRDTARFLRQRQIRQRILFLRSLGRNWDGRGAAAPSARAVRLALRLLSHGAQYKFLPDAIGPSPDGGIMLEFRAGENYFLVDMYNDGDIVLLRENGQGEIRTTQESEKDIDRIVFELWDAYASV